MFLKNFQALLIIKRRKLKEPIITFRFDKEIGIPDHLTCLLRNLYACQEATFKTRHGKRLVQNWKRVH